jgi:hypothetical protein
MMSALKMERRFLPKQNAAGEAKTAPPSGGKKQISAASANIFYFLRKK